MNENERKVVVRRMLLLIAVACIIMGLYTFRLIFLQLVNGDDFKAKATNTTDYMSLTMWWHLSWNFLRKR